MPVTIQANYREVFAPETLTEIDRLVEESYELDDILVFIDEHSEEEFRDYFEEYVEIGEHHGYDAVDRFINDFSDLSELGRFEDAYIGEYSSPAEMAEDLLGDEVDRLHFMIVVDWEETAMNLLDRDMDRYGNHYFRTYF